MFRLSEASLSVVAQSCCGCTTIVVCLFFCHLTRSSTPDKLNCTDEGLKLLNEVIES